MFWRLTGELFKPHQLFGLGLNPVFCRFKIFPYDGLAIFRVWGLAVGLVQEGEPRGIYPSGIDWIKFS